MIAEARSAASTDSKGGRNLCFVALLIVLTVITFAPMIWVPAHVAALKNVQFSFVWPPPEEPATVKVGDLELRVVSSRQGALQLGTEIVAQEADNGVAGSASLDKVPSKARAANFGALTNLGLLAAAFVLAALASIGLSLRSVRDITKSKGWLWGVFMLLIAVDGFLAGAGLVLHDPIGPIITQEVVLPWQNRTSFNSASTDGLSPIGAAIEKGVVDGPTACRVSNLILLCGALGGTAAFCFLLYVFAVLSGGSGRGQKKPNPWRNPAKLKAKERAWRAYEEGKAAPLKARKKDLSVCVAFASIALSLGVAVIDAFLSWGLGFLNEASREVATTIADASTAYYGGTFALAAVAGSALAFTYLRFDIEATARTACKTDSDGVLIPDPDWKKIHDLELDPLKAVSTFVVALGPVLTTGLLQVLSKSVA